MERKVTFIPATINPLTRMSKFTTQKRRVAGYARVSTDSDEQSTSYEAQVDYYTDYIKCHSDWEFVKVYTDEGISGVSTKNRVGFNSMIKDAKDGKIDLIVTKSVSRFARNTVDSLQTIRELKAINCEVFFQKENIYTFDSKGELLLTIMSSLAQEESRSISENVTWGHRKRFSDGKIMLPYKNFLGYDRGKEKDDPPVINPEQAKLVQRIYSLFMHGKTAGQIGKQLTAEGILSPMGKPKWSSSTIVSILTNEKYRGSARLQKCFTQDFLTKKRIVNKGEVPQYYIEHSHEAIIDPIEWDAVQDEIKRRSELAPAYSGASVLAAKIKCSCCGGWFGRKVWHSTDKYRTVIWRCNQKYSEKGNPCNTPHILEENIKVEFLKVFNSMIQDKQSYIKVCRNAKARITDTTKLEDDINELEQQISEILDLAKTNLLSVNDLPENNTKYENYVAQLEKLTAQKEAIQEQINQQIRKGKAMDRYLYTLAKQDKLLTEFDECLWLTTVDYVLVKPNGTLEFKFRMN